MDNKDQTTTDKKDQSKAACAIEERRTGDRSKTCYQVSLFGAYGTFNAFMVNLSYTGALVEITAAELGLTPDLEKNDLIQQTISDQFGKGFVIRFAGTELTLEADAVRIKCSSKSNGSTITLGCKFRSSLSREACICFQMDPPPAVLQAPVPQEVAADCEVNDIQDQSDRPSIRQLMELAYEKGATDLHIKVGRKPRLRLSGTLTDVDAPINTQSHTHAMAMDLMNPEQATRFEMEGDLELTSTLEGGGRYRISVFRQRGDTGLAIRCIPEKVPNIDSLGLSPVARTLAEKPNGLVLVTGPTGSGKSTTLAAMIHHVNQTRACNVVTMEDPIEYIHKDMVAQINQREIGSDVPDFSTALKRVLRQDPDVIMVGEMRDMETISLALTAAETGHLVFATLHTTSCAQTPARIIDVFPSTQQGQIRIQLADCLQGIISQLLLPHNDEGLVLAHEVMVASDGVRALIRDNKGAQLHNLIQTSGKDGMQTLESSLNKLVEEGAIDYMTALAKANNPKQIHRADRAR